VDGPGRLATRAFLNGISQVSKLDGMNATQAASNGGNCFNAKLPFRLLQGRGGKGSIFVWASGNGGRDHDNCNCDGYTNSIWTLSVSSATENGLIPWYSEACSSSLASTYSSGSSGERKVVTTDLHHTCTSSHTGTSASAPLAAGIVALCLQVNPTLTWRDAQHLTVRCAHVANLRAEDWAVNGVGRNYSHSFGYGIMDATCMVRLAKKWKSVPEQKACKATADNLDLVIPSGSKSQTELTFSGCDGVKIMEHVQARITLGAVKRGDILIYLVSPSGTKSNLLARRPRDYSRAGFNDWPFLSVHMWGEKPEGKWTLEVRNEGRSVAQLKRWELVVHGTEKDINAGLMGEAQVKPQEPPAAPQVPEQEKTHEKPAAEPLSPKELSTEAPPPPQQALPVGQPPPRLEYCIVQRSDDWCDKCEKDFAQHFGRCVAHCPPVSINIPYSYVHTVC